MTLYVFWFIEIALPSPPTTHTRSQTHTRTLNLFQFRRSDSAAEQINPHLLMFWLSTFQLTTAPVGTPLQTVLLCFFFKFIIIIILVSLNLWRLYYNANFLKLTQTQNLTRHLSFSKQVSKREVQKWPRQKVKVTIPSLQFGCFISFDGINAQKEGGKIKSTLTFLEKQCSHAGLDWRQWVGNCELYKKD